MIQWQSGRTNLSNVTAQAAVSFDGGTKQYIGESKIASPSISLYAPSATGSDVFSVYGQAPKNADVTIMLDGETAAVMTANKDGFYTARLRLNNPIGTEEHSVIAKYKSGDREVVSATQTVTYSSTAPYLKTIEITDYVGRNEVLWDNGEAMTGFYWYMPDTPVVYTMTFGNADKLNSESVIVHLPRANGVELLKAKKNRDNTWQTEPKLCGNNPPTGAMGLLRKDNRPQRWRPCDHDGNGLCTATGKGSGLCDSGRSGSGRNQPTWRLPLPRPRATKA